MLFTDLFFIILLPPPKFQVYQYALPTAVPSILRPSLAHITHHRALVRWLNELMHTHQETAA
jgi:hypothetical protein